MAGTPPSQKPEDRPGDREVPVWPQRLWARLDANPAVLAIVAYLVVALLAAVAAYYAMFSQFAPYDDEGSLLMTLKPFVAGHVLYRDIFTPFGPFYYELFGGFFKVTGIAITNDASRGIVTCLWVLTSLIFGVTVQRLSGRLVLGLAAMAIAFAALDFLPKEPMHPEGLSVLLLGVFALLSTFAPRRSRFPLAALAAGAVLAALVLTKINVGSLAVVAVPFAAVLTIGPFYRRPWLRWLIVALFLAVPLIIMARDLRQEWAREFIAIEVLAVAAIAVAAWRVRPRPEDDDAETVRWVLAALAGFVAMAAVVLAIMLATGVGLGDAWEGIISQAFKVPDTLVNPFNLPASSIEWGFAALAGAAIAIWAGHGRTPSAWPGILRIAAGLAIWLSVSKLTPIPLSGLPEQAAIPLVLAWVAVLPPPGVATGSYSRFLRVLLPAMAAIEVVQAYPVAGSQIGVAAATFVPVGGICLWDGYQSLRQWAASRGEDSLLRVGAVGAIGGIALVLVCGYGAILRPAATNETTYSLEESIGLPGAQQVRTPIGQGATYRAVVELIEDHHCTTLAGYPSINSFYLWTGLEAPEPGLFDPWMLFLDEAGQQRVVEGMEASPRPCVIRDEELAAGWLAGGPPPSKPLVNYIFEDYEPTKEVETIIFATPKQAASK